VVTVEDDTAIQEDVVLFNTKINFNTETNVDQDNEVHEGVLENIDTPKRKLLRRRASDNQQKQADRMKKRYREDTIDDLPIGTVVLLHVALVDRSKIDGKLLPCIVVEVTENGKYRLACKAGPLHNVYGRADFLMEKSKLPASYGLDTVLLTWRTMNRVSPRAGVSAISMFGGQGHLHCSCKGKCDSNRCACKKAGVLCNSRCHSGHVCKNND